MSYDFADIDILVEVFRDVLVFGLMPGYKQEHKKYNMQALQGQTVYCQDREERPVLKLADIIKIRQLKAQGLYVEPVKV